MRTGQASYEPAARAAVRAEAVLEFAILVVLEDLVQGGGDYLDVLVLVDVNTRGTRYDGPFFDELAVFREDLDSVVVAV